MNRYIKKISSYAMVGGMSVLVLGTIQSCGDSSQENPQSFAESVKKEGFSVILSVNAEKQYKIVEEIPSYTTRVILREENGSERILTDEELEKIIKEEEARIAAGTSNLTKTPEQVAESGGMGLAGTLLAGAAIGMLVGSASNNRLQNNPNYQANQRNSYKSPQTYMKSKSSFGNIKPGSISKPSAKKTSSRRSGFGSSSNSSKSSSSRSFWSFGG